MKNRVGLVVITIGALHTLLGLVKFHESFGQMIAEGIYNTGTSVHRGWVIWFTLVGILLILLGTVLKLVEDRDIKIPKSMGWAFTMIAILGGIMIPLSGFRALLLPAILIFVSHKK